MSTESEHLVDGKYTFSDLVDVDRLRTILEHFSTATGFCTGLLSHPDQQVLIDTGWRNICVRYHRAHDSSNRHCVASDAALACTLREGRTLNVHKCANGLVDGAAPIIIKGAHVANLFTGQVLFEKPDREAFRRRAEAYGYEDIESYLAALDEVHITSEAEFERMLVFLADMATMIAEQGLANLRARRDASERFEREENLRTILNSIGNAVISTDTDGRVTGLNPTAEQLTGWSNEEACGLPLPKVFRIVNARTRQPVENPVDKVLETGLIVGLANHTVLIRRDGGEIQIADSGAPIRDREGAIRGVVLVFRDVTEEYGMLERLEQLATLVEQTGEGMAMADLNGVFTFVNPAWVSMHGYDSADELIGRHIRHAHTWDQFEREVSPFLAGALKNGYSAVEMGHRRKDGSTFPCIMTVSILRSEAGAPLAYIGTCHDISDRMQVERERREAQEFLETALAHSSAGILIADAPDVRIRMANRAALGIRKGDPRILTGIDLKQHTNWRTFRPDGTPCPPEELPLSRAILKGEATSGEELIIRDASGEDRWVSTNAAPIRGADHEVKAGIVVFQDVTERKRAERAMRESERRYRTMFEHAPEAIVMVDVDRGCFSDANDNAVKLYGASREQLITMGPWDVSPPTQPDGRPSREAALDYIHRALAGEQVEFQWEHVNLIDGRSIPCELRLVRISASSNLLRASVIDITERKRVMQALEESEENLKQAQSIAKVGHWSRDRRTDVFTASDQMLEIFGVGRGELTKGLFGSLIHPDDRERVMNTINRAVEAGENWESAERLLLRDGTVKHIHGIGNVVKDENGEVIRLIGVIQDITEWKRSEEKLSQLQRQLTQAQKMESVGRLAGGVAHDFNNMLMVILGHTEMLLEGMDAADPIFGQLSEVRKAAERSADLTRQLLAFARKQTVAPRVLDLNDTVGGMLKMLQRLIGEDIDLAWMPGANLWSVKVDPSQIDQILANLCVNARDAIEGVGKITIETGNTVFDEAYCADHAGFQPGEYVQLVVSDDGTGIREEILANIFEPFFTTKSLSEGTGLGLATVYGIVKQNDGFVNVYSEPGQGTTFRIYLPRHAAAAVADGDRGASASIRRGRETILLVEDEEIILDLGRGMLEELGYTVITANGPGEALRAAGDFDGEIHLLLTDVVMPEMNGRDLARKLRALQPSMKRVFMSGYTSNVIAHRGILEEGVHFLQKPFSLKALSGKIREALEDTAGSRT